MKKFITLVEFGSEFIQQIHGHGSMRLISIGTTSDGYYTLRCRSDQNEERVFKIPCYDSNYLTKVDRVGILEHAVRFGKSAAAEHLKASGPDNYVESVDNYNDLLYLLTNGKEGTPMEDF